VLAAFGCDPPGCTVWYLNQSPCTHACCALWLVLCFWCARCPLLPPPPPPCCPLWQAGCAYIFTNTLDPCTPWWLLPLCLCACLCLSPPAAPYGKLAVLSVTYSPTPYAYDSLWLLLLCLFVRPCLSRHCSPLWQAGCAVCIPISSQHLAPMHSSWLTSCASMCPLPLAAPYGKLAALYGTCSPTPYTHALVVAAYLCACCPLLPPPCSPLWQAGCAVCGLLHRWLRLQPQHTVHPRVPHKGAA
jgi:hypothetical protein